MTTIIYSLLPTIYNKLYTLQEPYSETLQFT